ncbi:VanZ family protein [Limnoglobus roseus]|uniref:VanZ family protein n=1 Tax=Limnoglobus roseus TaxID=2598579 RepID=A0A5C1A9M8_9BACT|nr:VanZ family protein [Limnoglobus roseus]QEL15430.1 VanZ family protein [Limnoglobus roseus]
MNTDRIRREFPWMKLPGGEFLPRRLFGWLALGVVAFTIYGSFVPFVLRPHYTDHPISSFRWALEQRSNIQSRSDFLANFALGVPLGFCVLAWRLLDRNPNRLNLVGCIVALWPCCVFLAAAVEFGQLYFEGRTTSGSDIIAQSLGSAFGMCVFVVGGQWGIDRVRRQFDHEHYRTPAVALLVMYLGLLALTQTLPLDLSASPPDWLRKFRDGKATLSPFSELGVQNGIPAWRKGQAWLELAAVYLPVGLLLAFVSLTDPRPQPGVLPWVTLFRAAMRVFGIGLLLAVVFESCQFLVMSRSPSTTDVILGGGGVLLGWLLARGMGTGRGLDIEAVLILAQGWLVWLAVAAWLPFDFEAHIGARRFTRMNWLPFESALEKNYLSGLEEILTKTLLSVPFGVIVAAYGSPSAKRGRVAVAVAVAISVGVGLLLEVGQLYLRERVSAPMDVLYAAAGGWLGVAATLKLRQALAPHEPAVAEPMAVEALVK